MINQWQDYGELPCANGTIAIPCVAANGEQVLRTNGVDPAGIYHLLAFVLLWRRARPRQFEGAAPEDDTKGELRRQSEAEAPKLNIRRPKIALQWENLSMEADNKQGRILDGNAGFVSPGELLAIMGPSGSGKSTLLKSLAGIAELPLAQGSVVNINGECFSEKVREHTSFLFQDEQLFGNITVREHLLFQCRFRMGKMHPTECAQRSDALITELGLSKCKNTLIGSIGAGISGGERRRLAFATELLTEPTLLFADEATSGLDSAMALNVAKLLHGFARDGAVKKTVLATIHQPSEEVFNLFDKVLILVEGRTVYFGSPTGGLKHFASLELLCPHDESPPDFFMRCVATDAGEDAERIEAKANMEKLLKALPQCDAFQSADKAEKNVSDGDAFQSLRGSGLVAVLTLIRREFLIRRRSKILFKAMIARTFFMALLLGLLYWQLPNDQTSWQSVMGALNMVMINTFMTAGFGLTQELPHAFRPAFRKARAGMYSISAWFWSKTISDLPIDIIGAFCGSSVIFVMTGLGNSVASYLTFVLLVCLTAVMGNAWGYLASAAGGRAEYAFAVFLLTVFPFMIFNGFLITTEEIPIYFRWIEYVGPFKPVFSEMMVTIWNSRELECPQSGPCPFKTGQDVLRLRGLADVDHVYNWVIVIGVYLVGVRLLAWGVMVLRLRLAASNVSQTSKTSKSSKKVADTDGVAHSNEIA
ncbi:Protein white [Durusdinium trenchii]|uniref:Protein white n=2 Tax=Durusdinium trenchii TaxID=1381693 RepID=A0ABP0MFA5_9DINO